MLRKYEKVEPPIWIYDTLVTNYFTTQLIPFRIDNSNIGEIIT